MLNLFLGEGKWGDWEPFSECNLLCGGGNQTRVRECIDQVSGNSADNCPNFETGGVETAPCNTQACKKV